ncbi:hypothetical protein KI387_007649, partial [Taxus chinensis]
MSTGSPGSNWDIWDKRMHGTRKSELAEKRKNWLTAESVAFGTSGTKRRKPAEPGEMSQGSPKQSGMHGPKVREPAELAEMRTFVLEQLGQKDANRPNRANLSQMVRNQMGHMGQ